MLFVNFFQQDVIWLCDYSSFFHLPSFMCGRVCVISKSVVEKIMPFSDRNKFLCSGNKGLEGQIKAMTCIPVACLHNLFLKYFHYQWLDITQ